jgi:NAD(P)-dependent dehydrogenase (short-subunit alcohol dehydrogenase family)
MAEHKVYVNTVCPALTNTNMMGSVSKYFARLEGSTPEEMEAKFAQLIPLGRVATPDDIAKVVLFLVSSDSDYITGQSINVTGGGALKYCVSE